MLERQRVFLNARGEAQLGVEEITQMTPATRPVLSPLHFDLYKSCNGNDEVPMMPCHAKGHRKYLLPVSRKIAGFRTDVLKLSKS